LIRLTFIIRASALHFALQHKSQNKSLAKFFNRITLEVEGENRPAHKETKDVLEDTEDRRSAGRHGNQHVCLRGPQIAARKTSAFRRRWTAWCDDVPVSGRRA
jgi:hypothetical protein